MTNFTSNRLNSSAQKQCTDLPSGQNILLGATIKKRFPLTKKNSSKQTWHITLDLTGIDLEYHPGDSVAIFPQNDPILVDHLIEAMHASKDTIITHKRSGKQMPLHFFLIYHANLSRITSSFLKLIHECEDCPDKKSYIETLLSDKPSLRSFLAENDPIFLLRDYSKTTLPLQELCDQFGPMLPRFYSVASSKSVNKDSLDLTVALFTWMQKCEKRYGVASHFLCHLAEIGETPIPLYVQPAKHFRLPESRDTDIIMIGPGTGIAPFRAFIQERANLGASGKNWLFFGHRNRDSDYFYEDEWKSYPNLRIDTAFSRDQKEKVYVQHKLLEKGEKIYAWLQNGAHLYLCGDAKEMAKDVEKTLRQIIATHGNLDAEEAKSHLKTLKKEGCFLLDIY
ncbi:MAG: Sulfite reductase [NADPH] flavoprotein alpha-component [Chlamydiae bacterium]|nr:Sulfite reductase [NADPH] flavoprotein alpha-component [Chlamydiota bacterium]